MRLDKQAAVNECRLGSIFYTPILLRAADTALDYSHPQVLGTPMWTMPAVATIRRYDYLDLGRDLEGASFSKDILYCLKLPKWLFTILWKIMSS